MVYTRAMQRFYFNVYDGVDCIDEEGQLAADLAAAHKIALASVRALACEQIWSGYLNLHDYLVITDENGHELMTVRFGEGLEIRGGAVGELQ